jgi:crotonobetainyl-CoA:carnitine CoA-transferase CaiB-like acyl-CoA transferase
MGHDHQAGKHPAGVSDMLLADLRVIEIGQVLSAPYAGMIFADLGADVIKIEKPGVGDESRAMGAAFRDGASMTFHDVNRGKKSVVLDLKTEAGRDGLLRLLQDADILVHNLRPGEAERMRLDGATLTARFPRLIYCEMGSFGHKGPRRRQPGYEPLLQAYGGLISMNGNPDGPPARMGASLVDQGTANWTVIGALAALHRRAATGKGCIVNTSLLETALTWAAPRIHAQVNEGRPSLRYGTAHPNLVPYQAFETAEGPVMICAGNDRLFAKLAHVLGRPEWARDPRYSSNRQRLVHRSELVSLMQDILRTAGRAHWIDLLEPIGVPVAPVNSIEEVVADEQVKALDILRPVGASGFVLAGLPISFDGVRPPVERPAPALGADNENLLGGPAAPA